MLRSPSLNTRTVDLANLHPHASLALDVGMRRSMPRARSPRPRSASPRTPRSSDRSSRPVSVASSPRISRSGSSSLLGSGDSPRGRRPSSALSHPRWPPAVGEPDPVPRRLLVSLDAVVPEGTGNQHPAGEGHGWRKVSDHLPMGAHPPVSMGYTPSFGGRQFHRRKSTIAYLDQPVGGRYQWEYLTSIGQQLQPRLEAGQTMPQRRSMARLGHHFAYHGGSPRGLPLKEDPYAGRLTRDGYLTEVDIRDCRIRKERPPVPRPQFAFSEYRDLERWAEPRGAAEPEARVEARGRSEWGSDSTRSTCSPRARSPRNDYAVTALGTHRDTLRTPSRGSSRQTSPRRGHEPANAMMYSYSRDSMNQPQRHKNDERRVERGSGHGTWDRALDFALVA